jgi:hypothetical protein
VRFRVALLACLLGATACAVIAGLDDPSGDLNGADAGDGSAQSDGATNDGASDGGSADADAGRRCSGPIIKTDGFEGRTDATAGWARDFAGDGGLVEISDGGLHVYIPPAGPKVNVRRQLGVEQAAAKRMCVSFTVRISKPQNGSAYLDAGDTTFGFIHAEGADASTYQGVGIDSRGVIAYVFRDDGGDTRRPMMVPILTKWTVLLDADFVANTMTIAINDREEQVTMIRPAAAPTARFSLGIRNYGPAAEAEAVFDDVVVTAE